jgi:hypothetical protein
MSPQDAPMIPITHPFRKVREKDGAPAFLIFGSAEEPDVEQKAKS